MRSLLMLMAMVLTTSLPAATDSSDVMAVVHGWTDAFKQGTFATGIAPCSEDAVIIDDFPPHVWQPPQACSKWYEAFEAWASKNGVTQAALMLGEIRRLDVGASSAYLVAPVTLSYLKGREPVNFAGTITLTLRKQESGWRVTGMAWADQ